MRHVTPGAVPCHPDRCASLWLALLLLPIGLAAQTTLVAGYSLHGMTDRPGAGFDGIQLGLATRLAPPVEWVARLESLSGVLYDEPSGIVSLSTGVQFGRFGTRGEAALGVGFGGYALTAYDDGGLGGFLYGNLDLRVWLGRHVGVYTDLRLSTYDGALRRGGASAAIGISLRPGR
ncbi:MAG: hypothetical protein KBF47_14440 [Gemmatimonadales bacterium]|nr:hypothetical protein [Gemmatimonadales bacterium]